MILINRLILTLLIALVVSQRAESNALDHRYQIAFNVQSLSIEYGLSQSVVNDIIQDSDGYVWLATEDGLNRYNGYDFKIFDHVHSDPDSIHENLIESLAEEPGKGIWAGTQYGLSFFDFKTEKFTNYSKNKELQSSIYALTLTPSGKLYIGSDSGLFVLNKATQKITPVTIDNNSILEDEVTSLHFSNDALWVSTEFCVYSISETSSTLKNYCDAELGRWIKDKRISVVKVKDNILWIGTKKGMASYHLTSKKFQVYQHDKENSNSLVANWIQDIEFDNNGNLWIGTSEGLSLYQVADSKFKHFTHKIFKGDGLTSDDIMSIYIDSTGLIWLGTYTAGVNILNPELVGFKNILSKSDLLTFDISNTIHAIEKDYNETLWFANYGGGLINLDLMTGKITRPFKAKIQSSGYSMDYVYSLLIDYQNRLWVGTRGGIVLIDLKAHQVIPYRLIKDNKPIKVEHFIFQIYEDHLGTIWIATLDGLFQVEKEIQQNGLLEIHVNDRQKEIPYSFRDISNVVNIILESGDGNLWMGGAGGLLRYSQKNSRWTHYEYDSENNQSISNNDIQVIFEDSRAILWVGTASGLNKVNRAQSDEVYFERITKENGLPNNSIYGIQEDIHKQLWLSTNLGLVRYSEHTEIMQSFKRNDGLSSNEFNKGAYFTDSNGVIYFGSINGVTLVDGSAIQEKQQSSRLKLTEVMVGKRELGLYDLNHAVEPEITKQLNESTIMVSVAELYYRKLGVQSYRYRLKGFDQSWTYLGKERSIILAGLAEGNYQLEIQSKTTGEDWLPESIMIRINVLGSFIKSDAAIYLLILGIILTCILVLYFVKRYYSKGLLKVENLLKIEGMRIKEEKRKSNELEEELFQKINKINLMNDEINASSELLESHQFRDNITGFYRYENILKLLTDNIVKDGRDDNQFDLIMLIQVSDYLSIEKLHGIIISAELINYVASELKRHCPGNIHICSLNIDSFIIFADISETPALVKILTNLRSQIIRSQISVANDMSIQTRLGITYLELDSEAAYDASTLIKLSKTLINIHNQVNPVQSSCLMRIKFNRSPVELANTLTKDNIIQYLSDGLIIMETQ